MSSKSSNVDVLIIGAGPAGLTAANCFNGTSLSVRVVDKKSGALTLGKADSLKSISIEVFDSFGLGDAILNECLRVEEIVLWDADVNGVIQRTMTIPDRVEELMKQREIMLDQGIIERLMCENLKKHGSVQVSWDMRPVDLHIDGDLLHEPAAYPITVILENIFDGIQETVHAKHVIGSDGARSWVRKQLNINFAGDLTDSTWGVMNVRPKTNFPDIRKVFVVHSIHGTIMGVPRENRLVRLYISMDGGNRNSSLESKKINADSIVKAAQAILAPYTLEAASIPWWSAYCVGQRVADEFSRYDRIFLAGDAVHTHSPKAGQGMNTSIQDGYNIGWKLRYCLENNGNMKILSTYQDERRPVAQALIEFDRKYLKFFARTDITPDDFLKTYLAGQKFTTGIGIRYLPSIIVRETETADSTHPAVATKLVPGMRLPDFQMVNQSDGVPIFAHHRFTCDGHFRILVFAGDIAKDDSQVRLNRLGDRLSEPPFQNTGIEIFTIHSSKRADVELMDLHVAFRPWSEDQGWDYWKVYADDESYHHGHGHAYERCGIHPENGGLVVLRPDGYISGIFSFEQVGVMGELLAGLGEIPQICKA